MSKYLKMADWFSGMTESQITDYVYDGGIGYGESEAASHAINSHDELVEMNQELLEALEKAIDFLTFEGFDGMCVGIREDYDISEQMKPFLDVMAKAKGQ